MKRLVLGVLTVASLHAATGGLRLDVAGTLTSNPSEVVSGTRSVKGSYTGTGSFTNFLRGDSTTLNLQPNQSYRVTYRYKVLVTPDKGFNAFFVSPNGYQRGFAPVSSSFVQAAAGTTGTATFTERLQNFDDYILQWTIVGQGAIAVDNIQIFNAATGEQIGSEDAEPGTALLSAFFVSATKPVFTWGETVKVIATLYDENSRPVPTSGVTWTVDVPARATVAADGTVTPRAMQTFVVRASLNGMTGEVRLQPVPRRIAVVAENATMTVGASQRLRADVMDVNDRPIPEMAVTWSVTSLTLGPTENANIDQSGMLKSTGLAKVRVVARINYSPLLPGFEVAAQGETLVEMKLAPSYRFESIFTARASGAESTALAPRPTQLIPSEPGGFLFAASLDGLGSALLEWKGGNLQPLLVSGRTSPQSGYPLADFGNYARAPSGDVLVAEADVAGGKLLSKGLGPGTIIPIASDGSPIFGVEETGGFEIGRNALADSGAMLFQAGFTDAITRRRGTGLFRTVGRGGAELVVSTIDDRLDPADVARSFFFPGIANDGTVWFQSWPQFVLWRARPGEIPKKMISSGDTILGETVRGLANNFSGTPTMFVASNGDAVVAISTSRGSYFLLYHDGDSAPSASVAVQVNGLYWYDPKVGALIDSNSGGKGRGLYLWNKDGVQPVLLLNAPLDGSPIQEILSATCTSDGTIYVMASTASNPMVIARVAPDPAVLLRSADPVPVVVPPVIVALIPGIRSGMPLVLAGGSTGSVAQLDDSGAVTPVVKVGTRLPDQKYFIGSTRNQVRTTTDGRIFFAQNLFVNDAAIYSWDRGAMDVVLRGPLTTASGNKIGFPSAFEVNRRGDIAVRMTSGGFGTWLFRDGRVSPIIASDALMEGVDTQSFYNFALDEAGNVLFGGNTPSGSGPYFGIWDGAAARLVLTPESKMPDGRQVSISYGAPRSCEDGFLAPMFGAYIRLRSGAWDYLWKPNEAKANGTPANDLDFSRYDANRSCDVAFLTYSGDDLGSRASSTFKEIQDLRQLTAEGELIRIVQVLINDDGTIYVLGGNDRGEEVIYRATPIR